MIFIDTGAFIARYIQRDQYHRAAVAQWQTIRESGLRCCTTNLVLAETITLLGRRTNPRFAGGRARLIYESKALTIFRPLCSDEFAALDLFEKNSGQNVSFTDCVSFILMASHRIKTAFSFDWHFRMAGFELEPNGDSIGR